MPSSRMLRRVAIVRTVVPSKHRFLGSHTAAHPRRWYSKHIMVSTYRNNLVASFTAEFRKLGRMATASERRGRACAEVTAPKSASRLFGEPLFYPPTPHEATRQKHASANAFFEELWPIFFAQKILGIFPYDVTPTGKLVDGYLTECRVSVVRMRMTFVLPPHTPRS
jgi:hypothetical protein